MTRAERTTELANRIRADLVQRSLQGIWGHPVAVALVFTTTNFALRAPLVMWLSLACVFLQTAARSLALARIRNGSEGEGRWHHLQLGLAMSSALFWGLLAGWAVVRFGYFDTDTLLLVLYHNAIGFAAMVLLMHNTVLLRTALALMFVPPMVAHLINPRGSLWAPVLGFGLYLAYVGAQGYRLNRMYWRQVEDQFDLGVAAHHDCLTGLQNRLAVTQLLDRLTSAARPAPFCVLYVDLDRFKQVNDRYSHRVGDLFLERAARRLEAAAGEGTYVARLGGDEFLVVAPKCDGWDTAAVIAGRVAEAVAAPVEIEGVTLPMSASIGLGMYPADARDPSGLLRAADRAMYAAKNSGYGKYRFATDNVQEGLHRLGEAVRTETNKAGRNVILA